MVCLLKFGARFYCKTDHQVLVKREWKMNSELVK
jgi:hypothetical protein